MEVDRYWSAGSHSWASAVFLGVRYLALLGHVPLLYHVYIPVKKRVRVFASYHSLLVSLLTILISVLLAMRVYALYFRNKWILYIVAVEFIAGILLACWILAKLLPGSDTTATRKRSDSSLLPGTPIDIRTLVSSGVVVSVRPMKLYSVFTICPVSASNGIFWPPSLRFHCFVLTMVRSMRLWTHKEPFLHRICIDGLLYYRYAIAQLFWEAPLANPLC
ncbi:hypothetical protein BJV77DRAFT_1003007 [Russula vinacea]|nr:hypothetical protein BJV77DRAFT_1003007 [Russula vinacea]